MVDSLGTQAQQEAAPATRNDRPTLLWIGRGEAMSEAVRTQLERKRIAMETADAERAVEAVVAAAPDLVVLAGDAAADEGRAVLQALAAHAVASVVPVALLLDHPTLDRRLRAFRSGAVAVVPRSASAYEIAERVAELARELPERPGEAAGELGEATMDELVDLVSQELRSGILSVERSGGDSVRLVLGAGGPVAELLEDFVQRLKPLIEKAEPLRYELYETSGGRLRLLDPEDHPRGDLALLQGLRLLLMDDDPGRADGLAQALRARGALVGVTQVSVRGLERARGLDPAVIVLDAGAIEGEGFEAVRRIRRDPRLRWAGLLLARWEELWPSGEASPDLEELAGRLAPLVEHDRALAQRAATEERFDTRLELTGPSRMLRCLAGSLSGGGPAGTRHLTVRAPDVTVEVDLSEGLIVGATAARQAGSVEGTAALATLMGLNGGRVHVEKREHPATATVMLPVDEALDAAARQLPATPTSHPPPPLVPEGRTPSGGFPSVTELASGTVEVDDDPSTTGPILAPHLLASSRHAASSEPSAADLSWGEPAGAGAGTGAADEHEKETVAPGETPTASQEFEVPDLKPPAEARAIEGDPAKAKKRTMIGVAAAPPPPMAAAKAKRKGRAKTMMGAGLAPPPPMAAAKAGAKDAKPKAKKALARTMLGPAAAPPAPGSTEETGAEQKGAEQEAAAKPKARPKTMLGLGAATPPASAELGPAAKQKKKPGTMIGLGAAAPPSAESASERPTNPPKPLERPPEDEEIEDETIVGDSLKLSGELQLALAESGEHPLEVEIDDFSGPPPSVEIDASLGQDVSAEGADAIDPLAETALGLPAAAPSPAARARTEPGPSETDQPTDVFTRPPSLEAEAAEEEPEDTAVVDRRRKKSGGLAWALVALVIVGGLGAGAFVLGPKYAPELFGGGETIASGPAEPEATEAGPSEADAPSEAEVLEGAGANEAELAPEAEAETEAPEAEAEAESEAEAEAEPEAESEAEAEVAAAEAEAEATAEAESEAEAGAAAGADEAEPDEATLSEREREQLSDALARDAEQAVRRGELDEAAQLLARSERLDEGNPQTHAAFAAYYMAREDGARAVEHAELAARMRSRRARYHVLLGDARRLAGDAAGARRAWERALEVDPDNARALRRLDR